MEPHSLPAEEPTAAALPKSKRLRPAEASVEGLGQADEGRTQDGEVAAPEPAPMASLSQLYSRVEALQRNHAVLRRGIPGKHEAAVAERLRREFDAAEAATSTETGPGVEGESAEAWSDERLAALFEEAQRSALTAAPDRANGALTAAPDRANGGRDRDRSHLSSADADAEAGAHAPASPLLGRQVAGSVAYRLRGKTLLALGNGILSVRFEPSFRGKQQQRHHCLLGPRSGMAFLGIEAHDVPYFLPLHDAERTHLAENNLRAFVDAVGAMVGAYAARREQVHEAAPAAAACGAMVPSLYYGVSYEFVEFVIAEPGCRVGVSLAYHNPYAQRPTKAAVALWPLAKEVVAKLGVRRGSRSAGRRIRVQPLRVRAAEEALRHHDLPEAFPALISAVRGITGASGATAAALAAAPSQAAEQAGDSAPNKNAEGQLDAPALQPPRALLATREAATLAAQPSTAGGGDQDSEESRGEAGKLVEEVSDALPHAAPPGTVVPLSANVAAGQQLYSAQQNAQTPDGTGPEGIDSARTPDYEEGAGREGTS